MEDDDERKVTELDDARVNYGELSHKVDTLTTAVNRLSRKIDDGEAKQVKVSPCYSVR